MGTDLRAACGVLVLLALGCRAESEVADLEGFVVDPDAGGAPVEDARVVLDWAGGVEAVRTAADGSFVFEGLPARRWASITALKAGREAWSRVGVMAGALDGPLELRCPRRGGEDDIDMMDVSGVVTGLEPGALLYANGPYLVRDPEITVADGAGNASFSMRARLPEGTASYTYAVLELGAETFDIEGGRVRTVEVATQVRDDFPLGDAQAVETVVHVPRFQLDGVPVVGLDASMLAANLLVVRVDQRAGPFVGWLASWTDAGDGLDLTVRYAQPEGHEPVAALTLSGDLNRLEAWALADIGLAGGPEQTIEVLDSPAVEAHGEFAVGATLEWERIEGADHYELRVSDEDGRAWTLWTHEPWVTLPRFPDDVDPAEAITASGHWSVVAVGPGDVPVRASGTEGGTISW